jgi:hypothetical protein
MTFRQATRKAAAIAALLAFLSQSALAMTMSGSHATHPVLPVTAVSVGDAQHPAAPHHHHVDTVAVEAESAGEAVCDDERSCLCCIGSCASVLPAGAAEPRATLPAHMPLPRPDLLFSRTAPTLYRPPIAL